MTSSSSADTKSGDALMVALHEATTAKIDATLAQLGEIKQTAEHFGGPFADGCASTIKHSFYIDRDCRWDLVTSAEPYHQQP
jgi:hypothetical protein